MQDSQANCGSTALHNALAALGIRRSQAECERLVGVTAQDGASPEQLLAAARAVRGTHPEVLEVTNSRHALGLLRDCLRSGRAAILSVDAGEHYVAAIGVLGDRYLIADGAQNELVLSSGAEALAKRWRAEPPQPRLGPDETGTWWGLIL